MTRVLVIDDEPQIPRALKINLSVPGYDVSTAATGAAALSAAAEHRPDADMRNRAVRLRRRRSGFRVAGLIAHRPKRLRFDY